MKNRKKSRDILLSQISSNRDIKVETNFIEVLKGSKANNTVGIKTWGKLDTLVRNFGYIIVRVIEFTEDKQKEKWKTSKNRN